MNQIAKVEAAPAATLQPGNPMMPQNMADAMKLAELMSTGKLVPVHLQRSPGDCLMVIEQAMRWGMSPFAVAQATSVISGKLMFEGKLVGAALNSVGILSQRLTYEYKGAGATRSIVVSGTLRGETAPRTVEVEFAKVKTTNKMWESQPDQQLAYSGNRVWSRRHAPEVMLGVYVPEEFDEAPRDNFKGTTIEATAPAALHPQVAAPSEKMLQAIDGLINTLAACESPDEWLALDEKWKSYRAKLIENFPPLSERVESAFAESQARLFPAPAEDDVPPADEKPDPEMNRARDLAADMANAATRADLEKIGADKATQVWRKRMETERVDVITFLRQRMAERLTQFDNAE